MFAVMVIEDDEVTRRLMCQVLRRGGYDPIPASDGGMVELVTESGASAVWTSSGGRFIGFGTPGESSTPSKAPRSREPK